MEITAADFINIVGVSVLSFVPLIAISKLFSAIFLDDYYKKTDDSSFQISPFTDTALKLWSLDLMALGIILLTIAHAVPSGESLDTLLLVISFVLLFGSLKWGYVMLFLRQKSGFGRASWLISPSFLLLGLLGLYIHHQ